MSNKIYKHVEEAGKHLYRDPLKHNIVKGVQGFNSTNKVAGAANFIEVNAKDFIKEELAKHGEIAVNKKVVGGAAGVAAIYAVYKGCKTGIPKVKALHETHKRRKLDADNQDRLFDNLSDSLELLTVHPFNVEYRNQFRDCYLLVKAYSRQCSDKQKIYWQQKMDKMPRNDLAKAIKICKIREGDENYLIEVYYLEDKSLIREVEAKSKEVVHE